MATVRTLLKRALKTIPALRDLFAERDTLREQNERLRLDSETLKHDLDTVRSKWREASDELERARRAHTLAFAGSEPIWVPPGHFYSPIPSIRDLKVYKDEVFDVPAAIRGIDLNESRQVELLELFGQFYSEQPFTPQKLPERRYFFENPNYSYTDAIILYCMIRYLQPRKIIEIGSGYSSCAMLDINEMFFDNSIACTFVDPYPQLLRSLIKKEDRKHVRILGQRVQDVDAGVFRELVSSDILFVDSSHVAKTGSDVNYIFFKILPLLNGGVYVHFHDVFYPFEYPQEWALEGRAWNEAYLLRAFLEYNRAFEIQFFTTYLMYKHHEMFESHMPLCLKNTGGNLWLKKTLNDPELDRVRELATRKPKAVPKVIIPYQPEYGWLLGEGWHGGETDHCWMAEEASVQVAGPENSEQRLRVRGYNPHIEGVQLSAAADNVQLGSIQLLQRGSVHAEFSFPQSLVGISAITVHLTVDRVYRAPGDPRNLGLSVTAIEIV